MVLQGKYFYTQVLPLNSTGAIDSAVNGGVERYSGFFSPAYLRDNPEHAKFVLQLETELKHHLGILQTGLAIHGKICADNLRGLQNHLEEKLQSLLEKAICTAKSDESSSERTQSKQS